MLPNQMILSSGTADEQEMIAVAAREIGDVGSQTRTFALYSFCRDGDLEAPHDVSHYRIRSVGPEEYFGGIDISI
jgi:hypothetical protein